MPSPRCLAWAVALSVPLWLLILWPALGRHADVAVYAVVSVCSPDLLTCRVEPARRFATWPECEWYVVQRRIEGEPGRVVMGKCISRPNQRRKYAV